MTARHVAHTAPYRWPWDGALTARRLALVIVAAQGWFAERSVGAAEAVRTLADVADGVRAAGGLVVHVRLGGRGARPALPPVGSAGWALLSAPEAGDEIVDACGLDGFRGSPLDSLLRAAGRDLLLLGGLGLEVPVHSTLRSANDRGYECLLLADACAPAEPTLTPHAIDSICMSGGIFGAVGATADVRAALDPITLEMRS